MTGRRDAEDFEWFSGYFPAVEARNGQMLASANQHAAEFAWKRCKTQVAGSDAHALTSVGTRYTEVPGAKNKEEFFDGLRAGHGHLCGESGGYWKLTRDILGMHFVSDVVVGSLLGAGLGYGAYLLIR